MNIFGGPRAWSYLRCDRHYVAMSRRHFAAHGRAPEYEDGTPFPVRIQSDADLAAMEEWRLLAVQDPFDEDGPISPFWADAPMLEGVGSATAPPLPALLAETGATLEGLRLMDGSLVLKVENDGAAVQVLVTGDGPLMGGGGVRVFHDWGLRLPVEIDRLADLWRVSGGGVPRKGDGGRGARTRASF